MTIHKPYGVIVTVDVLGVPTPRQIGGLLNHDVSRAPDVDTSFETGGIYPNRLAVKSVAETCSFSTSNVDAALATIGTVGNCAKGTGTVFEMFLAKFDECTLGPMAGSVHRKYYSSASGGASAGLIVPESLSVEHRGDATYTAKYYAKGGDGGSEGLSFSEGVALPSIPDNLKRFTIGPITVAGKVITGVKSLNINFGVTVTEESADSLPFADHLSIGEVGTVITLRGINQQWLGNSGVSLSGATLTHANTSFYLRSRGQDSSYFDGDGATSHIKGTCAGLAFIGKPSGGGRDTAETEMMLWCKHDGTNIPLIMNTDQAIT